MSVLNDHQFEILPNADAFDGFVFGIGGEVSVEEFDPGDTSWLTQDTTNSRRGVRAFGRDVTEGKTWAWESHANGEDVYDAVDILERFASAWRPEEVMLSPGAYTAVRYKLAGRYRRVFGRPRRYSAPPTNQILNGYTAITHEFDCMDAYTYDDEESSTEILYNTSAEGGGFTLPAEFPLVTMATEGNGSGQLMVGGTARCYPIIRFNGAWTNPGFITDDWSLRWTGSIPADSWVEIDCRPWALTVLDQDGASRVEGIERRTWMEDMWFAPGSQPQIALSGAAPGGGASVTVRWRNAWNSI